MEEFCERESLNWDTATSLSLLQEGPTLCMHSLEEERKQQLPARLEISSFIPGYYPVLVGKEIAENVIPQAHLEG